MTLQPVYASVRVLVPDTVVVERSQNMLPEAGFFAQVENWFKSLYTTVRYSWFWFNESRSIVDGIWHISKLSSNKVTIIGSARLKPHDYSYQQAYKLAHMLAGNSFAVVTGGGSGIMQAAAEGTREYQNRFAMVNLGIGVEGLRNEGNNINQQLIWAASFEIRQWLLFNFSCAIVAFSGGVGTLYELLQILTLIDTKQMAAMPLILFGKEHWSPLVNWLKFLAAEKKLVSQNIVDMLYVTDSVDEAFAHIQQVCPAHAAKYPFNLLM